MKARIAREANARFPEEACGLVLAGRHLVVAPNAAEDRTNAFRIPDDVAATHWATGQVTAVWHSHCQDSAVPSEEDERMAVPGLECWIYSVPEEELGVYRLDSEGRLRLVRMV